MLRTVTPIKLGETMLNTEFVIAKMKKIKLGPPLSNSFLSVGYFSNKSSNLYSLLVENEIAVVVTPEHNAL